MTGTPELLTNAPPVGSPQVLEMLSEAVQGMSLAGGVFLDAEFTAPWAVISQIGPEDCAAFMPSPKQIITYHYVVSGSLLLQVRGEAPMAVEAGEIVVLPRNDEHLLASGLGLAAVDAHTLVELGPDGGARIRHGGGGERTTILCGFLGSAGSNDLLLVSLPRVLKLRVDTSRDWIESSIRFAASEASSGRSALVLSKIAELLFLEAVRRYLASLPAGQAGWLGGLRDPVVGRALSLLHDRLAHPWTADSLAREAGLSRSALADRFASIVGEPPMRYLARKRMDFAAQRLRETRLPVSQIAFDAGYEAEAAFNRAFKRQYGAPPATWRRANSVP
jgi:AraC-like DNA-binding protein